MQDDRLVHIIPTRSGYQHIREWAEERQTLQRIATIYLDMVKDTPCKRTDFDYLLAQMIFFFEHPEQLKRLIRGPYNLTFYFSGHKKDAKGRLIGMKVKLDDKRKQSNPKGVADDGYFVKIR